MTAAGTLSIVIPHMMGVKGADKLLEKCILSLNDYDDLVVVSNNGCGFGTAVNIGMYATNGDYIIVTNNDVEGIEGQLSDMPRYAAVSVPKTQPASRDEMPRYFYCIDRNVYQKLVNMDGFYYDPSFGKGYWEDDDLIRRLDMQGVPIVTVDSVVVKHYNGGGLTMKHVGEQKSFDHGRQVFIQKWG